MERHYCKCITLKQSHNFLQHGLCISSVRLMTSLFSGCVNETQADLLLPIADLLLTYASVLSEYSIVLKESRKLHSSNVKLCI